MISAHRWLKSLSVHSPRLRVLWCDSQRCSCTPGSTQFCTPGGGCGAAPYSLCPVDGDQFIVVVRVHQHVVGVLLSRAAGQYGGALLPVSGVVPAAADRWCYGER